MNRLTIAILLLNLFSLNACASEEYLINGDIDLSLSNVNGTCQVTSHHDNMAKALLIPWPCNFHKDTSGNVRVHEENGAKYLLVESYMPHADLPNDCVTHLQSIIIKGGVMRISEYKDTVASCPPFQWDTYVFTGLFKE